MRYELARDSDARAGGLRGSAIRTRSLRCLAVTVALVMFFMLLPTRAFASGEVSEWSSVWFHSSVDDGDQYIVGAYNKFDAAAYICGYTKQQVSSWDLAVLNKLSTRDTAFLSLADSLQDVTPWNEESLNDSLEDYFGTSLWSDMGQIAIGTGGVGVNLNGLNSFQVKYWETSKPSDMPVWAVNTTSTDVGAAKEAIRQILEGGGSGGGTVDGRSFELYQPYSFGIYASSGQNTYPYYSIIHDGTTFTTRMNADGTGYSGGTLFNDPISIVFESDVLPELPSGVTIDDVLVQFTSPYRYLSFYILSSNGLSLTDCSTTSNTGTVKNFKQYVGTYTTSHMFEVDLVSYTITDTTITVHSFTPRSTTWRNNVYSGSFGWPNSPTNVLGFAGVSGGDDEPTGPGDWPEDPSPEPPESPTVPTPTPPDLPTPYTPIIPPTVPPEPTTNVTDPTSWTDYTPWLQKILQQLRNINDEIADHCVHIQQQIVDQSTNIINALKAENESMKDYLYELQRGLTGYLKQLFEWLADQFDFESNPYNDSSVLYWLRLIYQRLGKLIRTNVPTVLEPDPTEPFDFWAWLWGLITNVIGGFIGDFVGDVGALIDGIKDKFPFSIPWDIAAMLALLDANRVTPVFVVNIPAINGWWAGYSYRIDLQPFDSVAAACRSMFNIVWCFVLIMKTNWMLMIMGDSTSLGERFANRVGRGTE